MSLDVIAQGLGLEVERRSVGGNPPAVPPAKFELPSTKEGRSKLLGELTEQRKTLVSELEGILGKAGESRSIDPEVESRFAACESRIADLDTRLAAVEAAVEADQAEDQMEMNNQKRSVLPAADFQARLASLRSRPERVQRRTSQIPSGSFGIVRDFNDRRSIKQRGMCLRGWAFPMDIDDEIRQAAQDQKFDFHRPLKIRLFESEAEREERTDMSSTAGYGGNTIATVLTDYIQIALKYANPMLDVANIFRTTQGNPLKLPTIDDTGTNATLGTEGSAPSASEIDDSSVTFNSYRLERLVKASNELLRDTAYSNLPEVIGNLLGLSIGRKMAAFHATGTGSSQPGGLVTGAGAGVTAASATAIAYNELIKLIYSVDVAYLQGSMFFMHPSIWSALLQLQDGFGRPLIGDTQNADKPNIKGYPVVFNPGMASSIATTNKTVVFGNPKYFGVRLIGDLEVIRFNELYGASYQTGFMAVQFHDSKVTLSAALKLLTQA